MPTYALERADPEVRKLVNEARSGESVVLTEGGEIVARVTVQDRINPVTRSFSDADIDQVLALKKEVPAPNEDSVSSVLRMRDAGA